MRFTDIFIKRPVLASVISILILVAGIRALHQLPLRQFPKMENTVITVSTMYAGANANLIQGFITSPLEKSVAGADGIDYLTSESSMSMSTIKAYIKLNYDPEAAFTNVMSKVAEVRGELPKDADQPIVKKETGSQIALMYISFSSDKMSPEEITDYVSRVVQPKLATVNGVASAAILGDSTYAMRIWLDPIKMAAYKLTSSEVAAALREKNFQTAAGKTKGEYIAFNVSAATDLHTVEEFRNVIIKNHNGSVVRLRDIAEVNLGAQNYDSTVTFNGQQAIFIGISPTPSANPLTLIAEIHQLLPEINKQFPPSLKSMVVYDATDYIRASIHEVLRTIIEATLIVVLVIFLFLGSLRSVLIPVVTIPLSLIGVTTFMMALGYSINLLTLLAMVLAIGLVVDDAIVVVENINRHIEKGETIFNAAVNGAREIALPIITMSLTLAAVYAPIGFMSGITGALFKEFAFTLASCVIISGVVALTLSPMMCSRILKPHDTNANFAGFVDRQFHRLQEFYQQRLHHALNYRPVTAVFAAVVLTSCFFLYSLTQNELAPSEDQSVIFVSATAPEYANIDYVTRFTQEFNKIFKSFPESANFFIINGMGQVNNVIAGDILQPWNKRALSQDKLLPQITAKLSEVAGLQAVAFPLPPLPVGGDGLPIEFVLTTTDDYKTLNKYSTLLKEHANQSGMFMFVTNSLQFNKPELAININRNKAATLGISMQDIGSTLATMLGGNTLNHFSMSGKSYEVIPQIMRQYRLNPNNIGNIHIKTANGVSVPLSTIVSMKRIVLPNKLEQFQQLNSATIQGMMMPGKSLGDALNYLQTEATKILPKSISFDYAGQSRQYIQEGNKMMVTFFFALLIIFLVLAAQFESFRDPWVILISVPMSICGALIPLNIGLASINIYTQVGLITLIGLISKHGILMVDFANQLRREKGYSIREAIETAASIRLRPILMTTAAMVLGVIPLLMAKGAGAVSRFDLGLVISTGMLIGTAFTLFVVPTMYTFFAKPEKKDTKDIAALV